MPLAFSGSLSGSLNIVGPLAGSSVTSSYPIDVLNTTLYSTAPAAGPNFSTTNSIFLGFQAGISATDANDSNFLGEYAGNAATNAYNSNFLGANAGYGAVGAFNSNFIGHQAGREATGTQTANFIGLLTGYSASNAGFSNFIGEYAGWGAVDAYRSNFIGSDAGRSATQAQYSTLIGTYAGKKVTGNGIGANNIIIGTSITLENDREDSINLGGIIFATGSYFNNNPAISPFSGSMTNAKVGINKSLPQYTLDVSGSGNFETDLIVSGTLAAPFNMVVPTAINIAPAPPTGSFYFDINNNTINFYNGTTWVSASLA